MKEKDWSKYQNDTLDDKVENLLIEFLNNYKDIRDVVDLGCGAGNELVYLLKRGYKVISIDRQLNKNYILDRLTDKEKNDVSFIESDFKDLVIPKTDCVMAMFSIPFCNPLYFDKLWNNIYDYINDGGYFIGQLFGDRDAWNTTYWLNTFSKDEVIKKLSKYEILLFDEIEYLRDIDNKKWHYFNIIAKKNKN